MVVADKPSVEVESNLAGPHVAIRYEGPLKHGNSGVLFVAHD